MRSLTKWGPNRLCLDADSLVWQPLCSDRETRIYCVFLIRRPFVPLHTRHSHNFDTRYYDADIYDVGSELDGLRPHPTVQKGWLRSQRIIDEWEHEGPDSGGTGASLTPGGHVKIVGIPAAKCYLHAHDSKLRATHIFHESKHSLPVAFRPFPPPFFTRQRLTAIRHGIAPSWIGVVDTKSEKKMRAHAKRRANRRRWRANGVDPARYRTRVIGSIPNGIMIITTRSADTPPTMSNGRVDMVR